MNKPTDNPMDGACHVQISDHLTPEEQEGERPTLFVAARRGLLGRCPNCGKGRLFASYLKQVDHCDVCGQQYGHIRSDDAAPWLTILVVGHLVVPTALAVESQTSLPKWVSMTLWPLVAICAALVVLPRAGIGARLSNSWQLCRFDRDGW